MRNNCIDLIERTGTEYSIHHIYRYRYLRENKEGEYLNFIEVYGGRPLCGEAMVQGSKNAALPILASTILISGISTIHNCPNIIDIHYMIKILEDIGCKIEQEECGHILRIDSRNCNTGTIEAGYAKAMRSSIVLLGALLGRMGQAELAFPGGCVIGERPIDLHIQALKQMGARIEISNEALFANAKCLTGCDINLKIASVGATENIILAAVTSKGTTTIHNAAKEPEITELCRFLKCAGANIQGEGTECIIIVGVEVLSGVEYCIVSDRIVAGTYLLSAVATRGVVYLKHAPIEQLKSLLYYIQMMGGSIKESRNALYLDATEARNPLPYIVTEVYPGFPTDLQSLLMTALSVAGGSSVIEEAVFNERFRIVDSLNAMGADICVEHHRAYVNGVKQLRGSTVMAEELRGGAALVAAGLAATGKTIIGNIQYIYRGYEDICRDFRNLGAKIEAR